jgi:WD40 repeat protein/serine/threonine protein kinase
MPPADRPATEDHPSPETLAAFLAGRLTPAELDALEPHIAACPTCCTVLRQLPTDPLEAKLRSGTAAEADPAAALADHPRYRLLEPLGSGGMGTVYKARHRLMDRVVALKVIHRRLLRHPQAAERFRREAKAAARLDHPNIVTAHDADEAGGCHFLVMEFIEGTSLAAVVAAGGPLGVAAACGCARQAALGLQHAFEHGMVHRDIKPQNLMLTPAGRVKVLDFGLAHITGDPDPPAGDTTESIPAAALTRASTVLGTPDYMAPEQAAGPAAVDVRTDVYALGCTLYFLLTGRPPFPDGTADAKLAAHREQAPPPLTALRADVPPELAAVVARMLAKDPADRHQTPAAVAEALRPFAEPEPPERRSGWPRVFLAALAALALLLVGVVIYVNTGEGTLVLEVNEPDVKVTIDGREVRINSPRDEIAVRVGRHNLRVEKDGFVAHADEFEVRRGGRVELTARLTRLETPPPPLADLDEVERRIAAGLAADPDDRAVAGLRRDLISYRERRFGTPESARAAALMARLAWPADRLAADRLTAEQRWLAGDGDPDRAPAAVVAVLGDGRMNHWSHANCVALTRDGRTLASGGMDNCVRVWDAATGRPLRVLRGHTDEVLAVAFAPGGDVLASGSADGTVRIWEVATGRPRHTCVGHNKHWVDSVAFAADGRVLYSGGRDGRVRLWDVADGTERPGFQFSDRSDQLLCVALRPDGQALAWGGRDGKVRMRGTAEGQATVRLGEHKSMVWAVTFSPDGTALASASLEGNVKLWATAAPGERLRDVTLSPEGMAKLLEVASGQPRYTFESVRDGVWSVAFDRTGKALAMGDRYGYVTFRDTATGAWLGRVRGQFWSVRGLAYGPGDLVAAASWDCNVKLFDPATRTDRTPGGGPGGYLFGAAVSPDGRTLATACTDGAVHTWDMTSGEGKVALRCNVGALAVAVSPDGRLLAATSGEGIVRVWDAVARREVQRLQMSPSPMGVAFSPDGKALVSSGTDGVVWLWDTTTWKTLPPPERYGYPLWSVAFSPDGKTLAAGAANGAVVFWDMATRQQRNWGRLGEAIPRDVAFSPDGKTLASAGHGPATGGDNPRTPEIALWDVATGKRRATVGPMRHDGSAMGVAFSPDGRLLASVGCDGFVRLWDPATGRERSRVSLGPPRRDVRRVAFTPDGRHVVTANGNGTAYVVRLPPIE